MLSESKMSITWTIAQCIISIRVTADGAYRLRDTVLQVLSSWLFNKSMHLLFDRSGATDNPSFEELRQRAHWIKMLLTRKNSSRCAIVVGTKPAQYSA